ncbi:2074_t:CDS:2, partial [Racocetra fulgida]
MTGRNLNIYFTEENFSKIKGLISKKEVSRFVNKAVEEQLKKEANVFRQQLVADYQDAARDKELNQELSSWDEAINDEIRDIHPGLVVSINEQNEHGHYLIVAPITSTLKKVRLFEVFINADEKTGLKNPSKILLNQIRSIDKKTRITEYLGKADGETMRKVNNGLDLVLGIIGDNPITTNATVGGGCTTKNVNLDTIASYLATIPTSNFTGLNRSYAQYNCPTAQWPGPAEKNPFSQTSTIIPIPTSDLANALTSDPHLIEKIAIPVIEVVAGRLVLVVALGKGAVHSTEARVLLAKMKQSFPTVALVVMGLSPIIPPHHSYPQNVVWEILLQKKLLEGDLQKLEGE